MSAPTLGSPPVVVTVPADRATWAVTHADPTAVATQSPAWADAMAACGWADASRHYRFPDGAEAGLPLVRRRGPAAGARQLRSLPEAWGFGGLVAPVVDAALVAAVMADLRTQRVAQVRIRPNPLHSLAWATGSPSGLNVARRSHVLTRRRRRSHLGPPVHLVVPAGHPQRRESGAACRGRHERRAGAGVPPAAHPVGGAVGRTATRASRACPMAGRAARPRDQVPLLGRGPRVRVPSAGGPAGPGRAGRDGGPAGPQRTHHPRGRWTAS